MAAEGKPSLSFPADLREPLEPYLPPRRDTTSAPHSSAKPNKPWITLTYAASLDSSLSLKPGVQTALSGPATKSMTHYLRTRHDAILVGSGTAMADDPTLNSRLDDVSGAKGVEGQPRPVILDRRGRWDMGEHSNVVRAAKEGRGKAPWVVTTQAGVKKLSSKRAIAMYGCGGLDLICKKKGSMEEIMELLANRDLKSIMVEGGGELINAFLAEFPDMIDAVIVTVAPLYLGQGGVVVCPKRGKSRAMESTEPAVKFEDVKWLPLENDVVMCAKIPKK